MMHGGEIRKRISPVTLKAVVSGGSIQLSYTAPNVSNIGIKVWLYSRIRQWRSQMN